MMYMRKLSAVKWPLLAVPILVSLFCVIPAKSTNAAYDGGNLIDNVTFLRSNSMSQQDIQNFLASKGSGLTGRSFVLNCYAHNSLERQWYSAVGAPCDQIVPASHIIYYAAKIYGINPQVILATMQKEQSLVTSPNPTARQIAQAMGYGCPTTGSCDDSSNFFYQIDSGTWVLRYHYERANGNMNWWQASTSWTCGTEKNFYKPNLYPGQNVRFYDGSGTHYRTHYIANAATSSFYCYTPHAYNNPQGLYGRAPYGTVGQYYSGSYNFVDAFESWFGSTKATDTDKPHPNGTLITDGKYIYRIENGTRRHISAAAFAAYGYSWNRVKPASSGDRNSLIPGNTLWTVPTGTVFTYKDGKVYVADDRSGTLKKQWISAQTFEKLGYKWSEVVITNSPDEIPAVTEPGFFEDTRHPSGSIVKINSRVYYIDKYTLKYVTDLAFNSNSFKWSRLMEATNDEKSLHIGTALDLQPGTVLYSGGNIYFTDRDSGGILKRPIGPWECYNDRLRYVHEDWLVVPPSALPVRTGSLFTC